MAGVLHSAARRPAWRRYGAAVVLTLLVVAGRLALDPSWGRQHNRHLVFLPTVMLAAWLGGLGPGLVASVISAVALGAFWTEPANGLSRMNVELVLFFVISVAICGLIESLHRARARADAARGSREQLLAVVAHDLRNPLAAIKMTSSVIQQSPPEPGPLRRRMASIDRAVARMERLIRDLIDATRIEHGEFTVSLGAEAVRSIVQEVADLYLPLAQENGLTLEIAGGDGDWLIACDRDRLLQALGNLMGNALKFTPEGGRVTLTASDQGETVRFEVSDTGLGISPEHLPHIFERYWKSGEQGTGLGLFIAQSIVRAHRGELTVRSQTGQGASFSFAVPRARAAVPVAPPAPAAPDQQPPAAG
jgi:signal transduction histidine kinase